MLTVEEKILQALERQRFDDWHQDKFHSFISGDDYEGRRVTRQEILDDIKRIFGVGNPLVRFE